MGSRRKPPVRAYHVQPLYLEPDKADLLKRLSAESRISKAALLREAVDDLLTKHGVTKAPRRRK